MLAKALFVFSIQSIFSSQPFYHVYFKFTANFLSSFLRINLDHVQWWFYCTILTPLPTTYLSLHHCWFFFLQVSSLSKFPKFPRCPGTTLCNSIPVKLSTAFACASVSFREASAFRAIVSCFHGPLQKSNLRGLAVTVYCTVPTLLPTTHLNLHHWLSFSSLEFVKVPMHFHDVLAQFSVSLPSIPIKLPNSNNLWM